MKELIKKFTPSRVAKFVVRLGKFYDKTSPAFQSQDGAFRTLKALGWSPRNCIDVGAYHGEWAIMFQNIFPETKVLMVEGQSEKMNILDEVTNADPDKLYYEIALLGATDGGEVDFVEMETGSSVFEESSPYPRSRRRMSLKTLDKLLESHPSFQDANVIKLDTQGYELEILIGAERLLENTEIILLEVSLLQINEGAPLISEVFAFLTTRNFKLFDFCGQIRRKDGVLWQTDLIFIRDGVVPNLKANLTKENFW